MRKKFCCILTAGAMVLSLAACGSETAVDTPVTETQTQTIPASGSYTGTVSAITTDTITLTTQEGEITLSLTDSTVFTRNFASMDMPDQQDMKQPDMGQQSMEQMGETPPAKPEGDHSAQQSAQPDNGQTMPEGMTGGEARMDGQMPEDVPQMPENVGAGQGGNMGMEQPALTLSDIHIGDEVTVETDETGTAVSIALPFDMADMGDMGGMGGGMAPGGMDNMGGVESYDAAREFTADADEDGGVYTSTAKDENAIHVYESSNVTLQNATISRDSADSTGGDNSSFYGIGAAALVTEGTLNLSGSTITTNAAGGAGVFAYGEGTARVSDCTINTARDTSGGIHVAGGGTLYAWNLTVETNGESSAAIRSDRGSGTMVVDGGSYTSNGVGSPAIYSAADITVRDADLTATGSEAICIEGLNSIRLFDCNLTGNMQDLSQNDCTWNIILYQSMSGDSQIGNSTFQMVGGSLKAGNGGMFYTTNTESTFLLSGVDITYADDSEFFLKCTGNANQRGWGKSGSNGADCHFTARAQQMQGDVIWDQISQLDFYILDGSSLTGGVVMDNTLAVNGGNGYASVYLDESSTWTVTSDSTVTNLSCAGTIVDGSGNSVTIQTADGTILAEGTSEFTITVLESYGETVDASGASEIENWENFEVAKA